MKNNFRAGGGGAYAMGQMDPDWGRVRVGRE